MTARPLVVIGAGEHARVVADAARSTGTWDSVVLSDASEDDLLAARLATTTPGDRPALVLGFGTDLDARGRAVERFEPVAEWATIVHARGWVSPTARLLPGAVVLAGAIVNTGAEVGRHAIVNTGAVVEHDCTIGELSHVAPRAVLGGGVVVGERVLVGLGAVVRDHVTIGNGAIVGMGSVVVRDVERGQTVAGNPARPLRGSADG